MKLKKIICLCLIILTGEMLAQTPTLVWQKQFDYGGRWDNVRALAVDNEGNYIIAGFYSVGVGGSDVRIYPCLTRFSKDGVMLWSISDTTSNQANTWSYSLLSLPGENAYIFGKPRGEARRLSLVEKYSYSGTKIWERKFGEAPLTLTLVENENAFIATSVGHPGLSLKLTPNGDSLDGWAMTGTNWRIMNTAAPSGRFYTFGDADGGTFSNIHGRISSYTPTGGALWHDTINDISLFKGTIGEDGGIYTTGNYLRLTSPHYWRTDKFSKDGQRIWTRLWDGDSVTAYTYGMWPCFIIPYPGGGCLVGGSVTQPNYLNDGNFTDFAAIVYDSSGNVRWKMRWRAFPTWWRNDIWAATWDKEGYLIFAGSAIQFPFNQWRKLFLMKFYVPGVTEVGDDQPAPTPNTFSLSQNYPNPFNSSTTIAFSLPERSTVKLTVLNLLGQEVATLANEEFSAGTHKVTWDASGFFSGVYILRFETNKNFVKAKKMILVK